MSPDYSGDARDVEVCINRLDGSSLFTGRFPREKTVWDLLEHLKVSPGSSLMVGTAPMEASSLVGACVGDSGCVAAVLVTTGLETEKWFRCEFGSADKPPLAIIFLPANDKDPVAAITSAISEKLAAVCRLDMTSWGCESNPCWGDLGYEDGITLLVEGGAILSVAVLGELLAPTRLLEELRVEHGASNPTRCYTSAKLLQKSVDFDTVSTLGGETVWFEGGGPGASDSTRAMLPLWRPHHSRWRVACAQLDDGRVVESGGKYEDSYDPMFCIFNDVLVRYPDGCSPELYTYPRDVFPPTDDHACVQVGGHLYLLGNAGYTHNRGEHMQVLRLDLENYSIEQVNTKGSTPKWCSQRQMSPAVGGLADASKQNPRLEGRSIVVDIHPGPTQWLLNVDTLVWSKGLG